MNDKLATVWWALKQELPVHPKMVLIMLANYTNDEKGYAWPTYAQLSKLCGMPESTCRKYVQWLVDRGLIIKEKHIYAGRQRANRYYLPVNVMAFQGATTEHPRVLPRSRPGATSEQPRDTLKDTPKDTPISVAGDGEANSTQKEPEEKMKDVKAILPDGHKSFRKRTKAEIFAKLKYNNQNMLTPKSCGMVWDNARLHASEDTPAKYATSTYKDWGRLNEAQKRCPEDFADVVWHAVTNWHAFTVYCKKTATVYKVPEHPSLPFLQKFIEAAQNFYNKPSDLDPVTYSFGLEWDGE